MHFSCPVVRLRQQLVFFSPVGVSPLRAQCVHGVSAPKDGQIYSGVIEEGIDVNKLCFFLFPFEYATYFFCFIILLPQYFSIMLCK